MDFFNMHGFMFVFVFCSSKWWIGRSGLDLIELKSKLIMCNLILQIKKNLILTNVNYAINDAN